MSKTGHDPSGKSNLSFQVGGEILDLLLLYADFYFSTCKRYLN